MDWDRPRYSSAEYDQASEILRVGTGDSTTAEYSWALEVTNNWRAANNLVLNIFRAYMGEELSKISESAFHSSRIKRIASIERKLRSDYAVGSFRLREIQDIAGCRAILETVDDVTKFASRYNGRSPHFARLRERDYIKNPKPGGYRSIHVVFQFESRIPQLEMFNGVMLEMQVRTLLQHAWSTAVEIVDAFTHQELKVGKGDDDWKRFFALMAGALALYEQTGRVHGVPKQWEEIALEVRELYQRQNVQRLFIALQDPAREEITRRAENPISRLMTLDLLQESVSVMEFGADEAELALEELAKAEEVSRGSGRFDSVLVGVESLTRLPEAYPNYYLNIQLFHAIAKDLIRNVEGDEPEVL